MSAFQYALGAFLLIVVLVAICLIAYKAVNSYINKMAYERSLDFFISNIQSPACLVDPDQNLVRFSDSFTLFFESVFGIKPEIGLNLFSVQNPTKNQSYKNLFNRILAGEDTAEVYNYFNVKTASFYEFSLYPVRDMDQNISHVGMLIRDVTDRKKQEANNIKTQNEIFEIMAHDLKAPLMIIKGMNSVIDGNADIKGMVGKTCEHAISSINNSLSLFKYLSGAVPVSRQSVHLSDMLSDKVLEFSQSASAKNLKIVTHSLERDLYVKADNDSIGRVIDNLILNAIKYSEDGGEIGINLIKTDDGKVRMTIADKGIGIPDNMKKFIFQRFTKAKRSGTNGELSVGLGLYIVHSIVSMYEGTISFDSQEGVGTTFSVELPSV